MWTKACGGNGVHAGRQRLFSLHTEECDGGSLVDTLPGVGIRKVAPFYYLFLGISFVVHLFHICFVIFFFCVGLC